MKVLYSVGRDRLWQITLSRPLSMSPTGSASWWPWQSSKLHRIERHLDDMKKQIEDLKADKERLIADKERLIADKDTQLKDLKADKDTQLKDLKADKDTQLKDLKADKERLIADMDRLHDQLQQQKIETLQELSRVKVIANNRALIEIAMNRYRSGMSLTRGLEMFVKEHLLIADTKTLSDYGRKVCKKLRDFGFAGKEDFVGKELENLMHEISKPLHRPHVSGKIYTGYVVGGDPPLAEALAIVISKLQECKLVEDLDVLLVDGKGECKCVLTNGEIMKYSQG